MRRTRSILPSLLALSLAAALPAAATAQDTPADANDVTYATGSATGEPAQFVPPTEEDMVDGIGTMRGRQVIGIPQEFTDPRLSGILSMTANGAGQEFDDGWAQIETRTYRIENDDGAWTGSGISTFAVSSDEQLIDKDAMVLTGEGAYDGLIAYVFMETVDDEVEIEAVILENEMPPVPDPVAANAVAGVPTFAGLDSLDAFLGDFAGAADGGVVALVTRDGETSTTAQGTSNADGDPLDIDRAFRVGSISKTFVSTMVLQLVEEGLVDLDAPLSTYLPDTSVGADVTIRQLLSHRSGIPSYTDQSGFIDGTYEDPDRIYSVNDILDTIADVPAQEPGGEFRYSNTNFILLGQLLESVGGADLDTALRTRIAEPLGLQATAFDDDSLPAVSLAGVWDSQGFEGEPLSEAIESSAWSAGALISTPADLSVFLSALLGGQLISDELLGEMLDSGPEGYALGIGTMPPGAAPGAFYGHPGGISGYRSFMAGDPDTGDVVVVLANDETLDPVWAGAQILEDWAPADA